MTFEFKNLGPIKDASIEMGKLTVVCGKNNTGKTYLTYGVWNMLNAALYMGVSIPNFEDFAYLTEQVLKESSITIKLSDFEDAINNYIINEQTHISLARVFNTNEDFFAQSTINLKYQSPFRFPPNNYKHLNEIFEYFGTKLFFNERNCTLEASINPSKAIIKRDFDGDRRQCVEYILVQLQIHIIGIIREESFHNQTIHIISSQRDGIWSFQKELDQHRSNLVSILQKQPNVKIDKLTARYTLPIEEHINFVRDFPKNINSKINHWQTNEEEPWAEKNKAIVNYIEKEILHLNYTQIEDEMMIGVNNRVIPLHISSSSVRVLLDIYLYVKYHINENSILMIDEPELSLHPENQIKLARLLVKLVNAGIKVWITTHSDYIVKELNNCLMLSNDLENKEKLMADIGYEKEDILKSEDLRMYIAHTNGTVERVGTDEFGMVKTTFDEAMIQQNENTSRIANAVGTYLEERTV